MPEGYFILTPNFWLLLMATISVIILSYSRKIASNIKNLNSIIEANNNLLHFYSIVERNSPYHRIEWDTVANTFSYSIQTAKELKLPEASPLEKSKFIDLFSEKDRLEICECLNKQQQFSLHVYLDEIAEYVNIVYSNTLENNNNSCFLWISKAQDTQANHQTFSPRALYEFLDTLPMPIWFRNKKDVIIYCNKTYADMLETTPENVLRDGQMIWSGKLLPAKNSNGEEKTLKQHVIISGSRKLFKFHELNNTIGYGIDCSHEEMLEKQITVQHNSFRDVLEQLSAGVIMYGADKRLQFFNHAYKRMFNMDESWLESHPTLGDVLEDLHHRRLLTEHPDFPAYKRTQLQLFNQLLNPIQELMHLPDERTIRMVTSPSPLGGLFFIFEDVTYSLVLERQAKTQMAVQKETLDHLYEAVAVFSSDNTLKLSNPAFAKIWKLTEKETNPGTHISDIFDSIKSYFNFGEDWEGYKQKMLENSTDRISKTGRINRTDETVLEFVYVPLPDGAHLHSYSDITDKHRIERALRERNNALEEADKLKSDFLSNVSFELKAPLNTIIGFTEILANNYNGPLNDSQKRCCRDILDTSNQLLNLVTDIIDLSSIEAGKMALNLQPMAVQSLLSSVVEMVKMRSKTRQIKLMTNIGPGIDMFVADERRLKQALFNLMDNAIAATPPGGKVSISAQKQSNFINLTIADTGPGISQNDQVRIFKKFERTEAAVEKYPGIGLGLSLVKNLVELHGGNVSIISKPGEGTKISCRIPYALLAVEQQELPRIA